jgi:HD-like signal output (HDOD) protein
MSQTVQEWTRQLASEPLLVMQRTLTEVRDLLRQSSVNHGRLSEVISRDPGFSMYVMRQINNLPNPPKEPITKISLAIPLLGMDAIEQASRTLPCLEEKLKGPPRRGLIDCYSRAAHAAIYARSIAERRRWQETDSLYSAALLHDISEMALWARVPDKMHAIHGRITQDIPRESAAQQILGGTMEELSAELSEKWKLPTLIHDSQGLSNNYQPQPLAVMLASVVARESSLGWQRTKTDDDIELLAEFLEISHDEATAYLHRLAAQAARDLHRLPLPLPVFHLIQGGLTPQKPNAAGIAASPQQKVTTDPAPAAEATNSPHQDRDTTPQAPVNGEKADAPAPKQRVNPLQKVLSEALQQMHEELGLSRTMFAMLSPDKSMLKARFVVESAKQLSLKSFVLSITKPSLFKALMNKPQAISLNRNNADKYLPMLPPCALEQINSSGFVSMSVFIKGKPVGLFYADNGINGPGVTRQQYDNFKLICQKTVQFITP